MEPNELERELELWEYIDGTLAEPRRTEVERLIAEHAAWRASYAALLDTHQLLQQSELEQPPMRFTRNVMEAIAREQIAPATRQYINGRIIRGLFGFFILSIILFVGYGVVSSPASSAPAKETLSVKLPEFHFDTSLMNIFLMVNIVLALVLLDRFLTARRDAALKH